jgi:hypothetical protein
MILNRTLSLKVLLQLPKLTVGMNIPAHTRPNYTAGLNSPTYI